jgi:hypothetical protein
MNTIKTPFYNIWNNIKQNKLGWSVVIFCFWAACLDLSYYPPYSKLDLFLCILGIVNLYFSVSIFIDMHNSSKLNA